MTMTNEDYEKELARINKQELRGIITEDEANAKRIQLEQEKKELDKPQS
jgi:hypothetical protein